MQNGMCSRVPGSWLAARGWRHLDVHYRLVMRLDILVYGCRSRSRRFGSKSSINEDRTTTGLEEDTDGRQLIKQYTLPTRVDVSGITSRRSDDGRLSILVPVRR